MGHMTTIFDFGRFDALTFDCYGTLIDWERGLAAALRTGLPELATTVSDDELLEAYAAHEATLEAGPYRTYREILGVGLAGVARDLGHAAPSSDAVDVFGGSVGDWPAFPDSAHALAQLKARFRLGVITNCDDDLFALSNQRLGITFNWVITAQQAGSYKPSPANFGLAFQRIEVPRERILHVAQSLYHDHVPAKALGMSTVWIDRRHGQPGAGATPVASAAPDLTFLDMASFAEAATT